MLWKRRRRARRRRSVHQGVLFRNSGDPVLYLSNPPGIDRNIQRDSLDTLRALNEQHRSAVGDPEIANEVAELGYPGKEGMMKALLAALEEVGPDCYRPPGQPDTRPGIPFVWESKYFKTKMYLKFKILGTKSKPVLWWYSCHPATEFKP